MTYLLIDLSCGRYVVGETRKEIISQLPEFTIDFKTHKLLVNGKEDTISYSHQYNEVELVREATERAIQIVTQHWGWYLYKLYK